MHGSRRHQRDEGSRRLAAIADTAAALGAGAYADYCRLRDRGLRSQALGALAEFVVNARAWPLQRRAEFADWVLGVEHAEPFLTELAPRPLRAGILDPTLEEWAAAAPADPRPWRWLSPPEGPRRALGLDPGDQVARRRLAEWAAAALDYATHELPGGYLGGDPIKDEALAREALGTAQGLRDAEARARLTRRLAEEAALIASYAEWRGSWTGDSFEEWARACGRPYK